MKMNLFFKIGIIIIFINIFSIMFSVVNATEPELVLPEGSTIIEKIQMDDESYIVAADESMGFVTIIKYDKDGNLVKQTESKYFGVINGFFLRKISGNGFVILYTKFDNIEGDVNIAKYNQDLVVEKEKKLYDISVDYPYFPATFDVMENGNYKLVAEEYRYINHGVVTFEFDKDFKRVSEVLVTDPEPEEETENNQIDKEESGKITKEKLKEGLQKVLDLIEYYTGNDIKIKEGKNTFVLYDDEGVSVEIRYDLNEKNPKCYIETIIEKGMSYEKFRKEIAKRLILMYFYPAIISNQGIDIEKLVEYISDEFPESISEIKNDKYIIDFEIENEDYYNEIIKEGENKKIIKESDFGNIVIEYIDETYKDEFFEDELKTFTITTTKEDISETLRKIVTQLEVNIDSDFLALEELINKRQAEKNAKREEAMKEAEEAMKKAEEAIKKHEEEMKKAEEIKKQENSITKIPYAGLETNKITYIIIINIGVLLSVLLIIITKNKKKK